MDRIRSGGLSEQDGAWRMTHTPPLDAVALFAKADLHPRDTRDNERTVAAVCATGDVATAQHYAFRHNRTSENDTPVLIEFTAQQNAVAVDGKDFLYTVFQIGDPIAARPWLKAAFGSAISPYVEAAWSTSDQNRRIALCELATHDPGVIVAHHASEVVLGGRNAIPFRGAFTVTLPIVAASITRVWTPSGPFEAPQIQVGIGDIRA